jgi:IS5 family transposase
MRQERTVQSSVFDLFAEHEIGRELKAMSQWLDEHRELLGLVTRVSSGRAMCCSLNEMPDCSESSACAIVLNTIVSCPSRSETRQPHKATAQRRLRTEASTRRGIKLIGD